MGSTVGICSGVSNARPSLLPRSWKLTTIIGTFFPSLNGMKEIYGPEKEIFREYVPDIAAFLEEEKVPGESVICDGKISHTGKSSYIDQFEFLKSILPKERHGEIKMTLVSRAALERKSSRVTVGLTWNAGCAQLVPPAV